MGQLPANQRRRAHDSRVMMPMRAGIFVRAVPVPVLFVALVLAVPTRNRADGQEQAGGEQCPEFQLHA